jgi:hypothetical protein
VAAAERSLLATIANGVLFQGVWVASVAGGAAGVWWAGPLAVLGFAAWQVPRSRRPAGELLLVGLVSVLGLAVDTAYLWLGLLAYPEHGPFPLLAPVWIVALWAGFALTLNHSLAWLGDRPVVAAAAGGLAGPFSYWVGARAWGAVELVAPTAVVFAVLAAVWAVATPALLALARRCVARDSAPEPRARRLAGAVPVRVPQVARGTAVKAPGIGKGIGS